MDLVTDIIEPGKSFTARHGEWWLRVERIAAWLVVDGSSVGRTAGRIEDVRGAASEALRALPDDPALTSEWSQHPLACIDPLVTPGYALEFSTWRHASWWTLSLVSLGAARVRITEKEQWLDGPPVALNVTDERVTVDDVDEQAARTRVEQELVRLTPKVVQRAP